MSKPRTYTDGIALASSVSRLLGQRASFTKSTERGTRVRGYRLRYAGYEIADGDPVRNRTDGTVRARVEHRMSTDTLTWDKDHDRTLRRQHDLTEAYHRYLTDRALPGWVVGPIEYGELHGYAFFYVTAPSKYAAVAS